MMSIRLRQPLMFALLCCAQATGQPAAKTGNAEREEATFRGRWMLSVPWAAGPTRIVSTRRFLRPPAGAADDPRRGIKIVCPTSGRGDATVHYQSLIASGDTQNRPMRDGSRVLPHFWWSVMARGKDALLP